MTFHLYSTEGCHLCEHALEILIHEVGISLDHVSVIDIAEDDDLVDRFGIYIPVLERMGTEDRLYWPFTADEARDFVQVACLP